MHVKRSSTPGTRSRTFLAESPHLARMSRVWSAVTILTLVLNVLGPSLMLPIANAAPAAAAPAAAPASSQAAAPAAAQSAAPAEASAAAGTAPSPAGARVPILVRLRASADPVAFDAAVVKQGGKVARTFRQIRTKVVLVPAAEQQQAIATLKQQPQVERVASAAK